MKKNELDRVHSCYECNNKKHTVAKTNLIMKKCRFLIALFKRLKTNLFTINPNKHFSAEAFCNVQFSEKEGEMFILRATKNLIARTELMHDESISFIKLIVGKYFRRRIIIIVC